MNIYKSFNEIIQYIEENLTQRISYNTLSKFLSVNEYTMQSIFSLLCNISVSEYIRRRRLSEAGFDLYNSNAKVIDIALKYQYDNPASFSRAFEKFHGIKPSQVKSTPEKLNLFPKLFFDESAQNVNNNIEYSIIELDTMILYGKSKKTTLQNIKKDAPIFFKEINDKYFKLYGEISYGMTIYKRRFESDKVEYWVLYKKQIPEFTKYIIPKSKWLCFKIPTQKAYDIQKITQDFYISFLPSCNYNISPLPELEYYHDGVTDFLVPIEDKTDF